LRDLRLSRPWGGWCSSGFWRRVDPSVDVNVSEKHTVCIFRAEDGDSKFLRNAGIYQRVYTAPKLRRTWSLSKVVLWWMRYAVVTVMYRWPQWCNAASGSAMLSLIPYSVEVSYAAWPRNKCSAGCGQNRYGWQWNAPNW
jgi:hypothetical protein